MSKLEGLDLARNKIRARDKHTCQICGKVWEKSQRRFDVHHLLGEDDRSYSQSRRMGEWITLCHKCHGGLHSGKKELPFFTKIKIIKNLFKLSPTINPTKILGIKKKALKPKITHKPEQWQIDRKQEMIRMRVEDKATFRQIAEKFDLSYQRTQQIVGSIERPKSEFSFVCKTCGKIKLYKAHTKQRKSFCNEECSKNKPLKYGVRFSENPKEYYKRQHIERYVNNPAGRAKHKEYMKRYLTKLKADPIRHKKLKEKQTIYLMNYYLKKYNENKTTTKKN